MQTIKCASQSTPFCCCSGWNWWDLEHIKCSSLPHHQPRPPPPSPPAIWTHTPFLPTPLLKTGPEQIKCTSITITTLPSSLAVWLYVWRASYVWHIQTFNVLRTFNKHGPVSKLYRNSFFLFFIIKTNLFGLKCDIITTTKLSWFYIHSLKCVRLVVKKPFVTQKTASSFIYILAVYPALLGLKQMRSGTH